MSPSSKSIDAAGVDVRWLDGAAPNTLPAGNAFGIPWAQGAIDRTTPISAIGESGGIPVQSWPLAYWPDGSLKWTGHAIGTDSLSNIGNGFSIAPGTPTEPKSPVSVQTGSDGSVTMSTGNFSGTTIVSSLSLSGNKLAQNGQLVLQLQNAPDPDFSASSTTAAIGSVVQPASIQKMLGRVDNLTVEQSGPVRGVIKVGNGPIVADSILLTHADVRCQVNTPQDQMKDMQISYPSLSDFILHPGRLQLEQFIFLSSMATNRKTSLRVW
ncbi:Putative protein YetA [Psilocybe cubensis]|uniref:Uncharacterized protein n=1 Tax=Psilocybe cubensis TaxID=181762 RepID=A0ACB8GPS4_PSICU|nr:Putative protein YetA [Psilocybe cubensis]KAH9477556.1 Putative protein YetA [Psilocybe cubensis]